MSSSAQRYVYVLEAAGGCVKIGYGSASRIVGQSGLRLIAAVPGGADQERSLHKRFRAAGLQDPGSNGCETFRVEGELASWLSWLIVQPFVATTIDELPRSWASPGWLLGEPVASSTGSLFGASVLPRTGREFTQRQRAILNLQSLSDVYHTPPLYIEAARRVMGGIDLDPASSREANLVVMAEGIYTYEDDGLAHDWHGRIWLNPPYKDLGPQFVRHLLLQVDAGHVSQAIVCLNANSVGSRWFAPLWDHALCFSHHRPAFNGPGCAPSKSAVFVGVRVDPDVFAAEFRRFGPVVLGALSPTADPPSQSAQWS